MGNEQSVPRQSSSRRPANKLSKPRTNNHLSGNTLNPRRSSVQGSRHNSISSVGNRLSTLNSESWPTNTEAGGRPKGDQPKKKRMSLFRSKASKKIEEPDPEPEVFRNFGEQGPNEQMLDRYSIQQRSRANSITATEFQYEPSVQDSRERPTFRERTHRWSTQQTPHAQQHNAQMNATNGLQSTQISAPEEPAMLRYDSKRTSTGLRSITNSEAGDDEYMVSRYDSKRTSVSGLRSRTNSETAIHGPIRRKSLQQHGVATRTGYFDNHFRQSMPATRVPSFENLQGQAEQSSERYNHQSSYNTSQNQHPDIQESKESTPGSVHVLRPTPNFLLDAPRTETPTETDYGHIGAFKLGTLRIVNGTASPTPSEREPSLDVERDEDVLSMKKARPSGSPKTAGKETSKSTILGVPALKPSWAVHSESPLHRLQESETTVLRVDTHLSLPLPDLSFDPFDFKLDLPNLLDRKPDLTGNGKRIQTRSVEIKSQDSVQDLALSPFSFTHSPPITPQLETTSKHMAVEDSLFDAEPLTPIITTPIIPRSDSKDSGYGPEINDITRPIKGPREMLSRDKPLAKADSGYSSNISLRSFKKEKKENLLVANDGGRKTELSRVSSGTAYSFTSSSSSETQKLRLQRSLPALPKQVPRVPSKESLRKVSGPPVSLRKSSGNLMGKKDRKANNSEEKISAIPKAVYESFSRETSPAISELSSISVASTAASTAPSTTSSRWRLGSKLKRESLQSHKTKSEESIQQPFTVQAFRGLSEQLRVPKPSLEVRKQLEKREQEFPVNSFKNTLPPNYNAPPPLATQLRRTASKETLGTIFSVGSMEVREELGFARLQKSLPAVPVEQPILEDPTASPTGELFPRATRKERERLTPETRQISRGVIEQRLTEKSEKTLSVEQTVDIRAPVKRPPRDWGRRSLAANFREKEAPESPPRKDVRRSLGPTPPQSPPRKSVSSDSQMELAKQPPNALASRLPAASKLEKVKTQEKKRDLDQKASDEPNIVQGATRNTVNELSLAQKPQNDRQSLPSQLARSSTLLDSVTTRQGLPSMKSEKRSTSSPLIKIPSEPTRTAPEIPSIQPRPAPNSGLMPTKVSVPALRRLYQTQDSTSSMPNPNSKLNATRAESDVTHNSESTREPQRQEWRRRSSNASRKQQDSPPEPEEMRHGSEIKSTSKVDAIQGPTDSHLITSIASYPASDTFKTLITQTSSESLPQSPKTLQSKKSQPSLVSNSSRRSLRAYPPQAHANRGPRSIFSSYQAPPPPGPSVHIGSQLQDQSFYAQIERRQSQEFEPPATSPRSERFVNKPPVSMTTQRNTVLIRSPPSPNPSQEYFALRNGDTLTANAAATAAPAQAVDSSWEPSRKFWSQRRRSAGNLNQNRRDSMESIEQPHHTLDQRRSMNLRRSDSSERGLNSQEHDVPFRGRPIENAVEPPLRRSSIGLQAQPEPNLRRSTDVQHLETLSQDELERPVARRQSGPRHSQPSEPDLNARRSMDLRRPAPSENELARLSRPEMSRQNSAEKRSRSVGFAPQPWEPTKNAEETQAFIRKRQSMDRMVPEPPLPTKRLSIDTLPSQTGQIGMRRASPSPVSTPLLSSRKSFDMPAQHTLQGSRRSFDTSQQYQNASALPHTLLQGSRRSFDQSQATGWTEQQKLAWSAQSRSHPYPPNPPPITQHQETLGTNPEFAANFPTIPKSISTYHSQVSAPTPAPHYYPPSPSTHFYPEPRVLNSRSSNPQMSPALSMTSQEEMLILDRYSGGLGYNFEAGLGISGSAGTGAMARGGQGGRKSIGQREMYGVDLSDVPVMLQRVRVES